MVDGDHRPSPHSCIKVIHHRPIVVNQIKEAECFQRKSVVSTKIAYVKERVLQHSQRSLSLHGLTNSIILCSPKVREREANLNTLRDEMQFYKLELVNREQNYNKVFGVSGPNIGVLNPTRKHSVTTRPASQTVPVSQNQASSGSIYNSDLQPAIPQSCFQYL